MIFRYRVLDAASKSKDGFLEAEDVEAARRGLEIQGLFVVELGEAETHVLEELAKQRAEEEAAKPPPPPPGHEPARVDRLHELWNLPATRMVVRVAMALGLVLVLVQTFRTLNRPPAARPEPVARAYRLEVKGAVTPGESQIAFIFPEIPIQFDRQLSDIKSGPDGAFVTVLEFSSAREPKNLVVRVEKEGFADKEVAVELKGDVTTLSPIKLVAAGKKPESGLSAEQQQRRKRLDELKEAARKREAARLQLQPPPERRRR